MNLQHRDYLSISLAANESVSSVVGYVRLRDGASTTQREFCEGAVIADYDSDGDLLGVEVLARCSVEVPKKISQGGA